MALVTLVDGPSASIPRNLPDDIKDTHQLANFLLGIPSVEMKMTAEYECSEVFAHVANYENGYRFGGVAKLIVTFGCHLN